MRPRGMSLGEGTASNGDWTTTNLSIDNEAGDSSSAMDNSMGNGEGANTATGNAPPWHMASGEGIVIYDNRATAKMAMANAFAGGDSAVDGLGDEAMANMAAFDVDVNRNGAINPSVCGSIPMHIS